MYRGDFLILAVYNYIGALIGAGFASGQEILTFFVSYGKWGFAGIVLVSVIFGAFAWYITDMAQRRSCFDYVQLTKDMAGNRVSKALTGVTLAFSLGVYIVMMACFGELANALFGLNKSAGAAIMSISCALVLTARQKNVLRFNGALGLFTVAGIIIVTFYMLAAREQQTFMNAARSIAESSAYAGYNIIGVGVILCRSARSFKSRKEAALTGILSGIMMFVMMSGVFVLLSMYNNRIALGELPMLTMAMRYGRGITVIYSLMLVGALVTTALADGVTVIEMSSKYIGKKLCIAIMCVLGFISANAGFSRLIGSVYRILGYAGIVLMCCFLILSVKTTKNDKKSRK